MNYPTPDTQPTGDCIPVEAGAPTPRTEEKLLSWNLSKSELMVACAQQSLGINGHNIQNRVVDADFARQLERELIKELQASTAQLAAVTRERDEAKAEEARLGHYANTLNDQLATARADARRAWEAGFRLAVVYGDNHIHFDGEQKEKQWARYLAAHARLAAPGQGGTEDKP